MNSLFRTLTIAAVIMLYVATFAPAQPRSEARAAEPAEQRPAQAVEKPDRSSSEATNRQLGTGATTQSSNVNSSVGRSTGYRGLSGSGTSYGYRMSPSSPVSRGMRQVFIIPAAEIEREDHLAIERDIHVMSHIFERVLTKPVSKIGGVFTVMDDFFGRDSHVTQVIYADGYGALFFMEVDFPLVGPPPAPEAKEPNEPKERVDTAWKQAERELFAPPDVTRNKESRSGPEYDAEKVELLKKNLVETLKHAANIQALKSDESVILVVAGKAIVATKPVHRGNSVEWTFRSGKWVPAAGGSRTGSYLLLPPSVLTIRANKSDIDAFSRGELDLTSFYERTQLLANWSGFPREITPGDISSLPVR